jgi:hypothetical protein
MTGWLMNVEQFLEWKLEEKIEVLGENPPQCYLVHHKSHTELPGVESGSTRWDLRAQNNNSLV